MAYPNNIYPQFYPQMGNYPVQNVQPIQQQTPIPQQISTTPAQSGLVSVRNEEEARNYPVAYGNSVTFKDETAPYVYTKTMGFSQLEPPRFEKYRLVKEDVSTPQEDAVTDSTVKLSNYAEKSEIEALRAEIKGIKDSVAKLSEKKKKREVIVDDDDE